MQDPGECTFSSFFVAGISYRKSDTALRGKFSLSTQAYSQLLQDLENDHIKSFFILSTCNRTEIYGLANSAQELSQMLCKHTEGSLQQFREVGYTMQGEEAVNHLFDVASGKDSQILGDYEIIGQLKTCIKMSKQAGRLNNFFERLTNEVFAASKAIRTKTKFSSGTVSVSFAAMQYLKQKFTDLSGTKILLIGTGKIGTNTCRNILDYLPGTELTLVNRSDEKAKKLAGELNIAALPFSELRNGLRSADVVIVSTQSPEYIISKEDLAADEYPKIFIDMSVPCNINDDILELSGVVLTNVDELSKINDQTLAIRMAELPLVENIIKRHMFEFATWYQHREHVPKLVHMKKHLSQIVKEAGSACPFAGEEQAVMIQKTINGMAVKLQEEPLAGCNYLQAMSAFLKCHSN